MLAKFATAMLNAYLQLDAETPARCAALQGRVLRVMLQAPRMTFFISVEPEGVRLKEQVITAPDLTFSGRLSAFVRASQTGRPAGLDITGDEHLAPLFLQLLQEMDVDWENHLATVVGDVSAYQLGRLARSLSSWLGDAKQAFAHNTTAYLQEEAGYLPTRQEAEVFLGEVVKLQHAAARFEARLARTAL